MLETLNLDGKVVVITGGGTGLGRERGRHMARAGADIVIAARRPGPIEEAADEVRKMGRRSLAVPTDATDTKQIAELFDKTLKEFGKVDVLFNNAGIVRGQRRKQLWEITDDEWRVGIDVNMSSAFYCSRAIIKHMVDRGKGRIVNVSSGFGLRAGRDNYMYGCGKAAVVQLTRILAFSYGAAGVTSTCIVPGVIPTESSTQTGFGARNEFIPLGRSGIPNEIGPLAVFLASDACDYMNGEIFAIDGGALAAGASPTGYAPVIPLKD